MAAMLGQSSVDYAHLTSIDFNQASSNIGTAMGGHFSIGQEETATSPSTEATFSTLDRTMHVCPSSGVTACHLVVPPSCGSGSVTSFANLGSIDTRNAAYGTASDTRSAIGRSLRWAGQDFTKDFSGSCLKVEDKSNKRYLVPAEAANQKCAMSTLFGVNVNKTGFCAGRYVDSKATFAHDPAGRKCRVVTAADFATVSEALNARFAESNALQGGLTLTMRSFNPTDSKLAQELIDGGFVPKVTLSTTFNRETTADFLDGTAVAPSKDLSLTRTQAHALIGEAHDAGNELASGFVNETSFAENILKLSLDGESGISTVNSISPVSSGSGGAVISVPEP